MNIDDIKYSVQLNIPCVPWSEWRPITELVKEKTILSLRYDREVSWAESNEICKRIGLHIVADKL